jgi:hypothetical protein
MDSVIKEDGDFLSGLEIYSMPPLVFEFMLKNWLLF